MTKSDFLDKYPELSDNGEISLFKISLLSEYITNTSNDHKVSCIIEDYNRLVKTQRRNSKIDFILMK
jgi:hypothetical protein